MFSKLKMSFLAVCVSAGLIGGILVATVPANNVSAQSPGACGNSFLTFPAWYRGITDSNCDIKGPGKTEDGLQRYIWTIALNVIEIIMQAIGYLAVLYMIYGGFLYMTSNGNPEGAAKGLKTIINAAIGIAIGMSAIAIKNFLWQVMIGRASETSSGIVLYQADSLSVLSAALSAIYFIAGAVAVVVIIISGLTYVTSSGNSSKIAKAKNALLYAVIGLVVAVSAWALTNFIIGGMEK